MNLAILHGNTGVTPEARFTPNGKKFIKFTLATNRTYGKGDDAVTYTDWFNVECWRESVINVLENHGFKGQELLIKGRFQTDKYEDNGVTKYYSKVVADSVDLLNWEDSAEEVEA